MALIKSIDTPFGTPATYWKIVTRQEQYIAVDGRITLQVSGYASKIAREAGSAPMMNKSFQMPCPEGKTVDEVTREDMYTWLKTAAATESGFHAARGPRGINTDPVVAPFADATDDI